MTILPTAMRIQDDIPLVLGRRTSPDIAVVREIREAVAKVMAVQDFECKRHELSEMPVEVAAKPARRLVPIDYLVVHLLGSPSAGRLDFVGYGKLTCAA